MNTSSSAPTPGPYADRDEAGQVLAEQLTGYVGGGGDVVVLGLPRGGVPVAARVATALHACLDVLVVRKLGLPGHPELAMGAIAGVGGTVETVRNDDVLAHCPVPDAAFDDVYRRELRELHRREDAYRARRSPLAVGGRIVVVVDDGLATGSTLRAAVAAVRHQHPFRLVAAVPVGHRATCEALQEEVDDMVCSWSPEPFATVGQGYRDFTATSDEQVRRALAAAADQQQMWG